ncbi:hypothetical protein HN51_006139 [Arachis hypogaea]|uniref:uncharacterized protein n=1 Tax=Arachis hypogaea TaxID=3818 RepID=UPI000DED35F7|nr:uncharacterized protein LOC112797724 [Arachis hypogaea]QHO40024.1 uncharacterized protein DS421_4g134150 [Arachis hypogaea]QHO40025.1 uncharacterized protein DS421_4g134150 [Arachis hypogaea]
MEFFQNAKVVRLKSYHDKYLMANGDGETIYQDLQGCYDNAKWTVEILNHDNNLIRLKSFFGNYLTATNIPFLLGSAGKKVMQQPLPSNLLNSSSFEWEPIRDGMLVKLKTRDGGGFLRANDFRLRPWKNSVTHDNPHRTATANWILWDVEIVESREQESDDKPIEHRELDKNRSPEKRWKNYIL